MTTGDDSSMCLAPWYVLSLVAGGKVMPCCSYDPISAAEVLEGRPLGPGSEATPLEMVNTPVMLGVRQRMLDGKPVTGCETCRLAEATGRISQRAKHETQIAASEARPVADLRAEVRRLGAKLDRLPRIRQLSMENTCNLACRMCYPGYSSRVASDVVMKRWIAEWEGARVTDFEGSAPSDAAAPLYGIGARDLVWSGDTLALGLPFRHGVGYRGWTEAGGILCGASGAGMLLPLLSRRPKALLIRFAGEQRPISRLTVRVSGIVLHDGPIAAGPGDLAISLAALPRDDRRKQLDIAFELAPGEPAEIAVEALYLTAEPKGARLGALPVPPSEVINNASNWPPRDEAGWRAWVGDPSPPGQIMLLGGEPSLIPNAYGILDTASRNRSGPDTLVTVITNVTRAPPRWLELLGRFRQVYVIASIDDIGIRNDYIRSPSRWADILATLEAYDRMRNVVVYVNITVQAYNALTCTDVLRFAAARGYGIGFTEATVPPYADAASLPDAVIAEALSRIDRFAGEVAPASQPAAKALEMRAYYSEAHVRRRPGALDAFLRYTAELDAARGESFRTAFPELAERLAQDRTQHPAPGGGIRLAEAG